MTNSRFSQFCERAKKTWAAHIKARAVSLRCSATLASSARVSVNKFHTVPHFDVPLHSTYRHKLRQTNGCHISGVRLYCSWRGMTTVRLINTLEPQITTRFINTLEPQITTRFINTLEPQITTRFINTLEPRITTRFINTLEPKITTRFVNTLEPQITTRFTNTLEPNNI
jgi:hypothetical protein